MNASDSMRDQLCKAIRSRLLLRVRYHDRLRIIEPHLLGEYADGRTFLTLWLVRCEDDKPSREGWQNYAVPDIGRLEQLDETFSTRDSFNPAADARVGRILCAVPVLRMAD